MAQTTVTKSTTALTRNVPARRGAPAPKPKPLGPGSPTLSKQQPKKAAARPPQPVLIGPDLYDVIANEVAFELKDQLPENTGVLIIISDGTSHAASSCGWAKGKEADLLRGFASSIDTRQLHVGQTKRLAEQAE